MQTFSVASVTASCTSISNRAVSAAAEVDHVLESSSVGLAPQLSKLSTALHLIAEHVAGLREALTRCAAVSPALQRELPWALRLCEGAIAVVDKQLGRLQSVGPDLQVDSTVLSSYEDFAELNARLVIIYGSVLQAENAAQQDGMLASDELRQLAASAESAVEQVMLRLDILKPPGDASGSSRQPSTKCESPPHYSESDPLGSNPGEGPSSTQPTLSPCEASSKGKGKGFFSGLGQSFAAMTAAMRPRPEPFVVPLCEAARRGDHGQIKGIMTHGVNLNGKNEDGQTALICAIYALRPDTVRFLLNGGADSKAKDSKGKPPLSRAAKAGDLAVARVLLEWGADPNEKVAGRSIFVNCALKSDLAMVRLLLSSGADANTRDITGRTIFIQAVLASNMELVKLLLEYGADANSRDITGRSALTVAILADRMDMIKILLDHGADANVRDITSQPMLAYAVEKGNMELVKLLLDHGCDPNARDIIGQNIFLGVLKKNSVIPLMNPDTLVQLVKLFLEHGADPNQQTSAAGGQSALLWTIEAKKPDLATMLLDHGANPNTPDRAGKTPLLEAMQMNNAHLVKLLLQHGADANMEGKVSPVGFAAGANRRDMLQLLQSYGGLAAVPTTQDGQTTHQQSPASGAAAPPSYEGPP